MSIPPPDSGHVAPDVYPPPQGDLPCAAAAPSAGADSSWLGHDARSSPTASPSPGYPAWAFEPITAWIYLLFTIALAFTPLFPVNWGVAIVLTIYVYRERKSRGLPAFWWPFGVLMLGPLVYIFFVYRRRHHGAPDRGWV